jgi:hypothetical protein
MNKQKEDRLKFVLDGATTFIKNGDSDGLTNLVTNIEKTDPETFNTLKPFIGTPFKLKDDPSNYVEVELVDGKYIVNKLTKEKSRLGSAPQKSSGGSGSGSGSDIAAFERYNKNKNYVSFRTVANQLNGAIQNANILFKQPKDQRNYQSFDQNLIVAFNKMIDPSSVVMVSEFDRTGRGQSLVNTAQGLATKIERGGAGLTDETRIDLINTMKELSKVYEAPFMKTYDFYKREGTLKEEDLDKPVLSNLNIPKNEKKYNAVRKDRKFGNIYRVDEGKNKGREFYVTKSGETKWVPMLGLGGKK